MGVLFFYVINKNSVSVVFIQNMRIHSHILDECYRHIGRVTRARELTGSRLFQLVEAGARGPTGSQLFQLAEAGAREPTGSQLFQLKSVWLRELTSSL